MTEEYLLSLLYLERRAHADTRRKLAKAEHDRERYAKRIRFVQARHEILSREFHAIRKERDMSDLAFAAWVLQERHDRMSNPNTPLAKKLRSAANTLRRLDGMEKEKNETEGMTDEGIRR